MKVNDFINKLNQIKEEIKILFEDEKHYKNLLKINNNEIVLSKEEKAEIIRKKEFLLQQDKKEQQKLNRKLTFLFSLISLIPTILILLLLLKYNFSFPITISLSVWAYSTVFLSFLDEKKQYSKTRYLQSKIHTTIFSEINNLDERYHVLEDSLENKAIDQEMILDKLKNINKDMFDKLNIQKELESTFLNMFDCSLESTQNKKTSRKRSR